MFLRFPGFVAFFAAASVSLSAVSRAQQGVSSGFLAPAGSLPDTLLTPGAVFPVTAADICVPGYSKAVRNVPSSLKRAVYARYGIRSHAPGEYEVDHLISLQLGGSNSISNLWPESYVSYPWNAHVKDKIESRLHREVCAGRLDLASAQRAIARDWIATYLLYFPPPGQFK